MAGDKSKEVSFEKYCKLLRKEPEMPFSITQDQLDKFLCEVYNTDVAGLHKRTYNDLYDFPAYVLPILKKKHYQI